MDQHTNQVVPVESTERDMLAKGIHDAAVKAGIIHEGTPLTGPQLLLLCGDLARAAAPQQQGEPVARIGFNGDKVTSWHSSWGIEDGVIYYLSKTQPITADASFNQGIEESVNRAAAFVANNDCEIDLAGLAQEIRNGKRPTDMVTMTRVELQSLRDNVVVSYLAAASL